MSELERLHAALRASRGPGIDHQLHIHGIAVRVFEANSHELRKAVENYRDPEYAGALWSHATLNFSALDAFSFEVTRLLMNYVASAKTRVDLTQASHMFLPTNLRPHFGHVHSALRSLTTQASLIRVASSTDTSGVSLS